MLASLDKANTQIVVLSERDIRNLVERLAAFAPEVAIFFRGGDGLNRQPKDLEELFKYPNSQGREIVSLGISARGHDGNRRASLKILVRDRENVLFDATGDEGDIRQLNSEIQELLEGTRPWYSTIAQLRYGRIGGGIFAIVIICLFVYAAVLPETSKPQQVPKVTLEFLIPRIRAFLFLSLGLLSPVIVGGLLDKVKQKLFPSTVLLLGHGAQRHTNCEWVRTTVVVGFVISFFSGLLLWAMT